MKGNTNNINGFFEEFTKIEYNPIHLELQPVLEEYNNIALIGIEGCRKTRDLIGVLNDTVNFDKNYVIVAFKSYSIMREKQKEIMRRFDYTEDQVPICSLHPTPDYIDYYTDKKNPNIIYPEAKFVLVSQKQLQKCYFPLYKHEKNASYEKRRLSHIVVDEFAPEIGILPTLHYRVMNLVETELYNPHEDKISILKFLGEEYSYKDYKRLKNMTKEEYNFFFKAYWLEYCNNHGVKVIFTTSEILAAKLLGSLNFHLHEMESSKQVDFSKHTIHICGKENITSYLLRKMNYPLQKNWLKLGFKTIISNIVKTDNNLSQESVEFIKVVNHSSVRGSNDLMGRDMLTIVTHIPPRHIEMLKDALNYFIDVKTDKKYTYVEVELLFYRDLVCQSVGRVLGFRGDYSNHFNTYLLTNNILLKKLEYMKEQDKTNKTNIYKIPYTLKAWDWKCSVLDKFIDVVNTAKEKRKSAKLRSVEQHAEDTKKTLESAYNRLFFKDENAEITYDEVKEVLKQNGVGVAGGLQPKKLADYYSCEVVRTSVTTGKYKTVEGKKVYETKSLMKIIGLRMINPLNPVVNETNEKSTEVTNLLEVLS